MNCGTYRLIDLRVRVLGGGRRRRGGRKQGGVRLVRGRQPHRDVHGRAQHGMPRRRRLEVLRQYQPGEVQERAEAARRRACSSVWYVAAGGEPSCRSGPRAVGIDRHPRSCIADVCSVVLGLWVVLPVPGYTNMTMYGCS